MYVKDYLRAYTVHNNIIMLTQNSAVRNVELIAVECQYK